MGGKGGLPAMLEAEFRQLSQDARKSEGLASFFSSADHPEVKEAAERAVLKIRAVADAPDALEQLRAAKVGGGPRGWLEGAASESAGRRWLALGGLATAPCAGAGCAL